MLLLPLDLIQKVMFLSRKQLYTSFTRMIFHQQFIKLAKPSLYGNMLQFQLYHTSNNDPKSDKSNKTEHDDDNNDDEDADDHKQLKKLSWREKFKFLIKKYGKLAIITHFGVYFATLLVTFLSLNYIPIMRRYAGEFIEIVNKYLHLSIQNTSSGSSAKANLALTYVLVKFTEPIRLIATIYITRLLYRISRRK